MLLAVSNLLDRFVVKDDVECLPRQLHGEVSSDIPSHHRANKMHPNNKYVLQYEKSIPCF